MMDVYDGFNAYKTYLALKQHFTSSYDYFRYDGKVTVKAETFLKRRDKYFFRKIEKKHPGNDLVNFFVSNLIHSNKSWAGNMASDQGEEVYKEWLKKIQSLSYNFKTELQTIADYVTENNMTNEDLIKVVDGQHPPLLVLYISKTISIETLILLDRALGFMVYWDSRLKDDFIWNEASNKIKKYSPFIEFSTDKAKEIVKGVMT